MPLVRISLRTGKPPRYRRAIMDGIYRAMRETFNVPEEDRFMTVSEHSSEDFSYSKSYLGNRTQRRRHHRPDHRQQHAHDRTEEGILRAVG